MGSLDHSPIKDPNAKKVDFNIHPVIARDDIQLTNESANHLESFDPVSALGIQATSELNELPQSIPSPSVHMRKRPSRRTMNMSGVELELIEDEIVRLNTGTQVNSDETRKDMEFIPALAPGDRHKYTCKRVRVRESKPDSRTRHSLILPTRSAETTWRTTTPTTVNGGPGPEDLIYVSMQKDVLAKTVYPDAECNIKDFRVSMDPSALVEYLPSSSVTKVHLGEEQRGIPAMSFDFIRSTTGEFYLLNTGISVWAMDWCALTADHDPSGNGSTDYLAVGGFPDIAQNCENRGLFCKVGVQDAYPNMIQIWSMNCRTDMNKSLIGEPKAHLDICIVHDYGTVMDLKWCPSGNFSVAGSYSGDISRLGILAAAFSDGCIRIYTIPATRSLKDQLGLHTPGDGQSTLFLRNHEPHATIELGELCIMSLSWGTAQRLAAGCSNGAIAVFDIKAMLGQSKATLSQPDSEYLDPIFFSQVHQVSVRTVDWVRDCDAFIVPWVVLSSGYDGVIRYTDLRGFSRPVVVTVLIGMSMTIAWVPWANGCVYVDRDLAAKVEQLYQKVQAFRVFHTEGTIWDISYSDYHPYLAAGASNGMLLTVNPLVKMSKRDNMVQFPAYQLSTEVAENCSHIISSESSLQPNEEQTTTTTNAFRYNDRLGKHNVPGKTAAHYYNDDTQVALQKVQWSRCFYSASWLASGSGSGLVRVENMMRQPTANKPAVKLQGKAKKVVSPVNVCSDILMEDAEYQTQSKDILNSTSTVTSHNDKMTRRSKSRNEASSAQHSDVCHVTKPLPAVTGVDSQTNDQQSNQQQKSVEKRKRGQPRKLAK